MKVFILTEGGRKIGFGHITRCTALCEAFKKKGIKPYFIVNADDSIKKLLKGKRNKVFNWLNKKDELFNLVSGADIVILDSYLAKNDLYRKIAGMVKLAVYIDDNKRIDYPEGIVINGNIYAKGLEYPNAKGATYLLGAKYLPLRREFCDAPGKKTRRQIDTIMITFGGDDSKNMTPRVLHLLAAEFPQFTKKVMIGQGFNNVEQIIMAADSRTELVYYPDSGKIRDSMRAADIAVSAAGQTLYELAGLGVPAVAVAVAKNQLNNLIGWENAGFIYSAGWWEDKNIFSKISKGIESLEGRGVRVRKGAIGRRLVDGKGAIRIRDHIVSRLKRYEDKPKEISLRLAGRDDCKDIWLWRNNTDTRKASFDEKRIPFREHERWFNSKIADNNARIYIAEKGTKKIGVIRFESGNKSIHVNVNLNPVFFGKGFGPAVIKLGSNKFMSEINKARQIIAEIKKDNLISQKAFARAGYRYVSGNSERVIYMMDKSHE